MYRDAQDVPQAGEDLVNNLGVSVGSKLCGDDRLLDVFKKKKSWLDDDDIMSDFMLVRASAAVSQTDLPALKPSAAPRYRTPPSPSSP